MPRRAVPRLTASGEVVMPDLSGARALVTGASDGIGLEIASALAAAGAHGILPVRAPAKGERALARIRETTPAASLELRSLDLARLADVHALVAALRAENAPLDLLVLNAGVVLLGDGERHVTVDGWELTFQTNFLGHAALVDGLLPLLRRARGRVVVQCSVAAARARPTWDDLQGERNYRPFHAYAASKALLGLFGYDLARRSEEHGWGVSVNLCHPGVVLGTAIAPEVRALVPAPLRNLVMAHVGDTPAEAARPALVAAVTVAPSPGFYGPGGIFGLGGRPRAVQPFARLRSRADQLRAREVAQALIAQGP